MHEQQLAKLLVEVLRSTKDGRLQWRLEVANGAVHSGEQPQAYVAQTDDRVFRLTPEPYFDAAAVQFGFTPQDCPTFEILDGDGHRLLMTETSDLMELVEAVQLSVAKLADLTRKLRRR